VSWMVPSAELICQWVASSWMKLAPSRKPPFPRCVRARHHLAVSGLREIGRILIDRDHECRNGPANIHVLMARLIAENQSLDQSLKLVNVGLCEANLGLRLGEVHARGAVFFQEQMTLAKCDGHAPVRLDGA